MLHGTEVTVGPTASVRSSEESARLPNGHDVINGDWGQPHLPCVGGRGLGLGDRPGPDTGLEGIVVVR